MHDSQTSNSRLSSELCCKDQIGSNNNSALLDTTCSPNYDDLPPMEIVYDGEPTFAALPEILLTQHSWVTQDTEALIQHNRGVNSISPHLADSESTSRNIISLPSVPVVNIVTTGTTSFATRGQWNATLDICTTWISHTFLPFLISSSPSYLIPTVTNGCNRDSLLAVPSRTDPVLSPQDSRESLSLARHPRTDCAPFHHDT